MAKGSLRRFDVQAKWSVICSVVAAVLCLGLGGVLWRNYNATVKYITYGNKLYLPFVLALCAVTALCALAGITLGFSSAGQRRNDRQKLSWAGFFLGVLVMFLAVVLAFTFWMYKLHL